jgi:hypothetical protein
MPAREERRSISVPEWPTNIHFSARSSKTTGTLHAVPLFVLEDRQLISKASFWQAAVTFDTTAIYRQVVISGRLENYANFSE